MTSPLSSLASLNTADYATNIYTWAARPSSGAYHGQIILIDDPLISAVPVVAVWNGPAARWICQQHVFGIAAGNSNINADTVTGETTFATYTIQPGLLGPNGKVDLFAKIDLTGTTTAVSSTVRGYLSTLPVVLSAAALTQASLPAFYGAVEVGNRNNVASQLINVKAFNQSTVDSNTASKNTDTTSQTVTMTHQWGASGTGTGTARLQSAYAVITPMP